MVSATDTTSRRTPDKNLVGFLLGDARYAVDILRVREIINPLPLVQLPHAPEPILGVADHRGEVVPVVDLRRRFGLPPAEPTRHTKWILVSLEAAQGGAPVAGLVVDAVTDVFGAGPSDRRDVPALGEGDERRGIRGVFAVGGTLTFVIDVDAVADCTRQLDVSGLRRTPS